jgi:hypothetical protein
MLIRTNYSGPYRIKEIERGCTCPLYRDEIEMDDPPPQPEHIHLVLTDPEGKGKYYLNHYIESELRSLDKSWCGMKPELDYDYIEILEQDKPVQMELF